MLIRKNCKLEKVLGGEDRPNLQEAWLDVENKTLTASDGISLVRISVEIHETDISGWVPQIAIVEARKRHVICGDVISLSPYLFFKRSHINFRPWDKVLVELFDRFKKIGSLKKISLALNPRRLSDIADACGLEKSQGFFMLSTGNNREVLLLQTSGDSVRDIGDGDPLALIMPMAHNHGGWN